METKEIQKLIDFIAQSGLDEVNIETADLKIKVKRFATAPVVPTLRHLLRHLRLQSLLRLPQQLHRPLRQSQRFPKNQLLRTSLRLNPR